MIREWLGVLRSLAVYWRPGRQRALRELYRPFIAPGDLVFDVGAHVGDRVAAFSALGARVVALEPHPGIFRWLGRIVGRKEGVTLRNEAVGASPGTGILAVSRATPTVSTLADGWRRRITDSNPSFEGVRWEDPVEVPITTLDRLIATFGIPDFCKIDVEGYEAEVLSGLSRTVPALSVEFVAGGLDVARACLDRLEELGEYEFNAIPGEGRAYRFDGWVDSASVGAWLDGGADGVSSGDLYARIRDPDVEESRA
ncbi:MAG: FkbM family methyltransferase [Gemmatimonadota bacterium]